MNRIRLFPVVLIVLVMAFFVRFGHLVDTIRTGDDGIAVTAVAHAEEKEEEKAEMILEESKDEGGEEAVMMKKEGGEADPSDPFAPQFSDAELEVLQSLSQRRQELKARERELEEKDKLLEVAQKRLDEKFVELEGLRTQIENLIGKQQEVEEERFKKLVKIYETMKPDDAARIFNELQFDVLLSVVDRMSERKTAPIMARMDPIRARYLSTKLAEQKALPKPR